MGRQFFIGFINRLYENKNYFTVFFFVYLVSDAKTTTIDVVQSSHASGTTLVVQ